jgi:hypothetical protein
VARAHGLNGKRVTFPSGLFSFGVLCRLSVRLF